MNAANVKILCLDVDGVMTDGGIHLDDHGVETKRFHVRDGAGMRMWMLMGGEIAIITGRSGQVVQHRAAELGVKHLFQGVKRKAECFHNLLATLKIDALEAAMLGDDLPDLSIMSVCGYPMAVADASPEVRQIAMFTTAAPGGHGAVREAIEHLITARNQWAEAIVKFEER